MIAKIIISLHYVKIHSHFKQLKIFGYEPFYEFSWNPANIYTYSHAG